MNSPPTGFFRLFVNNLKGTEIIAPAMRKDSSDVDPSLNQGPTASTKHNCLESDRKIQYANRTRVLHLKE